MEYNQFRQLLQLKGIREKETLSVLEDFIEKFPYCQTSRLLFAKALHDQHNIHYDQNLKLAAAYAPNREVLRELIEMKTEDVEFEFPLPKKEEAKREHISASTQAAAHPVEQKEQLRFREWYSEDEISGRAFEEQKEKEKLVDPHDVIRKRLNEILSGSDPETEDRRRKTEDGKHKAEVTGKEERVETNGRNAEEKIVAGEEAKDAPAPAYRTDAEEIVYKEDIKAEQKLEEEMIHPAPEQSADEKAIIAQAEKAQDVLDTLELEHAMEESILDSLEKLPIIAPGPGIGAGKIISTPKEVQPARPSVERLHDTSPRPFTEWLKMIGSGSPGGYEEVKASKTMAEFKEPIDLLPGQDEPESQLSDDELIEKFLLEDPKIEPSKAEFYSPVSQAKKSVMDHEDVVSETLAQIYLQQGNTRKARWCYEKLMLLHPEKSAFFAALLKEIPEGSD